MSLAHQPRSKSVDGLWGQQKEPEGTRDAESQGLEAPALSYKSW